jgi:hypothetical protein
MGLKRRTGSAWVEIAVASIIGFSLYAGYLAVTGKSQPSTETRTMPPEQVAPPAPASPRMPAAPPLTNVTARVPNPSEMVRGDSASTVPPADGRMATPPAPPKITGHRTDLPGDDGLRLTSQLD